MYKDKSTCASIRSNSLTIKPLAVAAALFVMAGQVHASVNGATVAAGAATINTSGTTTTINQSTDRAVIHWKSFDIAGNETVQINQPASTSAILNRVDSTAGTHIDGTLNANGRVFVVNPNGVVVGSGGKINADGVVLSTLDVSDANFMQSPGTRGNTLSFQRAPSVAEASIVNDGTITSAGGGISLFGNQVVNSATGTLKTNGTEGVRGALNVNSLNLVAADSIDAYQDSFGPGSNSGISLAWASALANSQNNLVANDGAIALNAGQVRLQAENGQGVKGVAVRNTGSIDAAGYANPGSNAIYNSYVNVQLRSSSEGSMDVGGTINSQGAVTMVTGNGPLTVKGSINANGQYGTVLMGGSGLININADADIFAGNYLQINNPYSGLASAVSIDGNVAANKYVDVTGGTVSVNGSVSAGVSPTSPGYAKFTGDSVQVRPGSVHAATYYVTEGGKTTTYYPGQN